MRATHRPMTSHFRSIFSNTLRQARRGPTGGSATGCSSVFIVSSDLPKVCSTCG